MIRTLMYLPLFLFAATPLVYSGESMNSNDSQTLILYWENDNFAHTDRYYTNGTKVIWISGDLSDYREDRRLPALICGAIEAAPIQKKEKSVKNVALSLGQKIYTPQDIEKKE